jgi:NADPH:quinone reductase-like Zn-dependent oxidoreductase
VVVHFGDLGHPTVKRWEQLMRRIQFEQFGGPSEVLHVVEGVEPTPGPGDVAVRLSVRPVHPADLLTVMGLYGVRPSLPASPGLEGAGTIAALGPGVEGLAEGDRVVPIISLRDGGSWQELVVVPATRVVRIPEGLDDVAAAQTVVGPLTSWLMLTEYSKVGPGDWVIQNAASGAMGRFNREVATSLGVHMIDVVRRSEAADELRTDGASFVIDSSSEDVVSRVEDVTGGHGVSVALDAVGGESGAVLLQTLTTRGVHILYGALSFQSLQVPVGSPIFSELRVQGFWLDFWLRESSPADQQSVLGHLLQLMEKGEIVPQSGPTFDLDEVADAINAASAPGGGSGKVVLVG